MKVLWFYVFEFDPDSTRKQPIGAWITQDDRLDYVFDPAFPEDEEIPSDLINAMLEQDQRFVPREMLDYWRHHVGYYRSASEIQEEEVTDYAAFFRRLEALVTKK
ncbi:MAG: hypothetical protein Q8O14_12850 [bacterium]|nr:hypothetical protein [bacterium]